VEPPLFAGQPVLTGEPLLTGESVLTGKPVLTGDDMTEEVPTHETDPLTPKQRRNTTLILLRNDLGEDTPEIQVQVPDRDVPQSLKSEIIGQIIVVNIRSSVTAAVSIV
ncbi:unnamed protein product, partial [Leptidea sinapis]